MKQFWMIMRLASFLILVSTLAISAKSYSQKVSLSVKNVTVEDVLNRIRQQTGYSFIWSDQALKDLSVVNVSVETSNPKEAIKESLAGLPLTFDVYGKVVYIKRKTTSSMEAMSQQAPGVLLSSQRKITGVVTDSTTGEPIGGVTIKVKGESIGTVTDGEGRFNLEVDDDAVLEVSSVGYVSREIPINGKSIIQMTLATVAAGLEQLVVVGYGTQKKANLSGAISTINNKDIVRTKNENVLNSLTGKLPGVRVVQRTSAPGDYDTKLDIRGMGNPLVIVDEVPRDVGYLARMSSEEIESISVLKDGTAAIYGVKAGNGVILVTTKTGVVRDGKVNVTYNSSYSLQQFLKVPNSVDAIGYMTLFNEDASSRFTENYPLAMPKTFTEKDFEPFLSGEKKSYDWMDAVFNEVTPQYEQNLSVDGGSEKLRYYFTLGYSNQMGSYRSNNFHSDRWNMRTNVNAQINKRLSVKVSLGAIMVNSIRPSGPEAEVYKFTWLTRPEAPFFANDDYQHLNGDADILHLGENMIARTHTNWVGYVKDKDRRFNGTLSLNYDIPGVKGLSAKGLYDYSTNLPDNTNFNRLYTLYRYNPGDDGYSPIEKNVPSNLNRNFSLQHATDMQLGLYYKRSFNDHNLNSFLIFEENYDFGDSYSLYRELMVNSEFLFAGEEKNQRATEGTLVDHTRRAYIGQLDYDYKSRYIFAFRFRYDGSSRFPKGHRFGFFPSAAAAWRLSEEPFVKNGIQFLSDLKLRISYGEMGDDASAGSYPPTIGYGLNSDTYGWIFGDDLVGGVSANTIPNPNLTWYKIKMYNIAIDYGFFHNRLTGSFDLFKRDRSGLLATSLSVIPGTVGANLPQENLNNDRIFGYEVSGLFRGRYNDLSYHVGGQLSATKSMRRKWVETPAKNSYDEWTSKLSDRYLNIWWGDESKTQFTSNDQIINFDDVLIGQATLPGDWVKNDWNGDGIIDGLDDHPIATLGLPNFTYGISLGVSWRGLDMALDFQGAHGVYVRYDEVLARPLAQGGGNTLTWFMDRWHPVDPNADYYDPSIEWISGFHPVTGHTGRREGTNAIHNASYMRLKTAELGYTFPIKLTSKVGASNFRIYLSGYNLLTFTGLKNLDPERPGNMGSSTESSTDYYLYPVNRTFTVGAKIQF